MRRASSSPTTLAPRLELGQRRLLLSELRLFGLGELAVLLLLLQLGHAIAALLGFAELSELLL